MTWFSVNLRGDARLVVVLAIVLMMPWGLLAAIPGADNPDAYTQHHLYRDRLEYNLRTTVQRYKEIGRRDPRWDEPALKLLEGISRTMASGGVDSKYRPDHPFTMDDLVKLGEAAVQAGCDDPMVLDFFAVALSDSNRKSEAAPVAARAAETIVNSQYPPQRAAAAARRARTLVDAQKQPELHQRFETMFWDAALAAMAQTELPGADRRMILNLIGSDFNDLPLEKKKEIYERAKQAGADPWLTNVIGGRYYIKAAWDARGSGWAHTVTDEGWEGFYANLAKARECFLTAWKLHPQFPEPATDMITVVMGGLAEPGETERLWFERAVTAQFDYKPAYNGLMMALRPRWGGSYRQMYALGLECARTNRYDTDVPHQLIKALEDIRVDMDGDWAFWGAPGVFDEARQVFEQYARLRDGREFDYYQSWIAGVAWQLNRWDDGKKALDTMEGRWNYLGLRQADVIPLRTVSGLHALAGEHAPELRAAEQTAAAGKLLDAANAYAQVAGKVGADDPSAVWIKGRAAEHRWRHAFDAGEWVDLTPGEDLAGWYPMAGTWSASDGAVSLEVGKEDALMVCGLQVGTSFEYAGTVELQHAAGTRRPAAGLVFGFVEPRYYYLSTARPTWQRYELFANRNAWHTVGQCPLPEVPAVNTLGVMMHDGSLTATANDGLLWSDARLDRWVNRASNRVGLGTRSTDAGTRVRFTDLRIRRLPQ